MKDKEKLFKLLRESVEDPQESFAVEEMISKIEGIMPPIEDVSDKQKKFAGFKFYKNKGGNFCCTMSIHRFIWQYFNGEIPEGYDVHHRDLNHNNNSLSNLQLLTKDEHKKIHMAIKKLPSKKMRATCANCGQKYEIVNAVNNKFCSEECAKLFEPETRICVHCGKEFIPSNKNNIYCSENCNKNASRERNLVETTCLLCGKKFLAEKNRGTKFCSRICAGRAKERKEVRVCINCGKEFSVQMSSNRRICSDECHQKNLPQKEIKICPICGKIFKSFPSQKQKYCSRECYHKSMRKNPSA